MDAPAIDFPEPAVCELHSRYVSDDVLRSRKSAGAAFTLACDVSGLDDKAIYMELGIDPATFSRIKGGKNTLPADQIARFCEIVDNAIYPEWIAYQLGFGLVMLQSEAERRAEEAERRASEAEQKVGWLMDLLKGGKGAQA